MIAYQSTNIHDILMQEQAEIAVNQNCIEQSEFDNILKTYPSDFYSPNLFIRIGLFMLTLVIASFSFGLLLLLFRDAGDNSISGIAIFFGLVSYAILEYMVQSKNHFQSGVDDALMWVSAGCIFGGIISLSNPGDVGNWFLLFIIALYCSIRFADRLMNIGAFMALLGVFFFTAIKLGPTVKAFLPFINMAISALIYWLTKRFKDNVGNHLYQHCLQFVSVAALFCFYAGGNYFVVRELNNELFNLHLAANESIQFGWLFWLFTFIIPIVYTSGGIIKKDIVLIRVGLVLCVAIVFTVRYYYTLLPVETWMVFGGIMLTMVTYVLSRYLKTPKHGFSNIHLVSAGKKATLQIESLVVAETFSTPTIATDSGTNFGGGSFGGGGTSGEF